MAVFRVERNTGYTVMSNHHLRNKELTLKAKGLLSQMLSLPEDWDYTLAGLSHINREKIDAIREAVLPADRQLCEQITRSGETDLKRCAVCGSTFAAGSNRAKYCPDCAAKIRRRQKAESERNRRLRIKTTT